jgi:hypothetical protein
MRIGYSDVREILYCYMTREYKLYTISGNVHETHYKNGIKVSGAGQ